MDAALKCHLKGSTNDAHLDRRKTFVYLLYIELRTQGNR